MAQLKDLYENLGEDRWRRDHPFSTEIEKVHEIAFHAFRTDAQREEAYLLWLQRFQPCLFGRIAAAKQRIHFCFLSERDILNGDKKVAEKIQTERIAWKRRSLRPHTGISNPAHGFILLAISPRLALASPDNNLRKFSERLLSLWGVPASNEPSGKVYSETLYLKHPTEATYVQFRFSVDFFLAQGDGRWWQDHRIPGGIAFTANSAGHMRRFREWYEGLNEQDTWTLQTAMLTIDSAAETEYGKATWLRPLINGQPYVENVKCPFANPNKTAPKLNDADWTRYGGHLHTDHAIRDEFFWEEPEKISQITKSEYLEDFMYLYDARQRDHLLFIQGQNVAERTVFEEIGNPEDYTRIITKRPPKRAASKGKLLSSAGEAEVEQKLERIRPWALES